MIRVIIADDENRICKLIMKLIQWDEIGMIIVGTASNGVEALELIEKEKPDIAITDIRMPGYDGLQMIEKAKAINKDLEFIIISGYGQFEYAKKAIEYGVKDYLLKPINQEELLQALHKVKEDITKKRGQVALKEQYESSLNLRGKNVRTSFLNNAIESNGKDSTVNSLEEICFDFSKKFIHRVERLDKEGIKKEILHLQGEISQSDIEREECRSLMHEIARIYYLTMKSNKIEAGDTPEESKILEEAIDNSQSIEDLFHVLIDHIDTSLTLLLDKDRAGNLRQINQAKKYIEENYMKNITLEDLGTHIGFNPSYFSSLFKKETGTSFIEYLSQIRMEKAKELLRESDLRIQDICLMVGYNDVKYFSKSFMKYTGLKPNEYRKIFA
ncbi:response regulator [Irregularibacter muris]|uniref:Stage 0 sporulation protein A homolog n=1 Tax=Irregularibacter muris TaxID=1796619 RepID=A0AAE3HFB6_9FIRM|nr:response regulator [Irregularibacter muris]MCR1898462.1 response regulator [Irregularibacter muris]